MEDSLRTAVAWWFNRSTVLPSGHIQLDTLVSFVASLNEKGMAELEVSNCKTPGVVA